MPTIKENYSLSEIKVILTEVTDPEIPVLNIVEMGIFRSLEYHDQQWTVWITPTYSGCPAMAAIELAIVNTLQEHGIKNVTVKKDFSEAWTTNWMTPEARKKLKEYGIAPPQKSSKETEPFSSSFNDLIVPCPYCDSLDTELQSEFGSTACKAQYYCHNCEQPFEHFKCH